ncbi:hypothetical protein [Primorskyibacter sp. S87]|uniref:hypothetical protein n=1 Tax=Primorskyibacter sp. S87 TaxID=3415126 RepID=UPI003C7B7CBD
MLTVVVYVNETPVAKALAGNMSDLADVSDYKVRVVEHGAPDLDVAASDFTGWIRNHPRRTSVWHLVRKIAEVATSERRDTDG